MRKTRSYKTSICFEFLAADRCLARTAVGIESGIIPNSSFTSSGTHSSQKYHPEKARLHKYGCWIPKENDPSPWIQIDLELIKDITKIATQGRYETNYWTKSYSLSYSLDGNNFVSYQSKKVSITWSTEWERMRREKPESNLQTRKIAETLRTDTSFIFETIFGKELAVFLGTSLVYERWKYLSQRKKIEIQNIWNISTKESCQSHLAWLNCSINLCVFRQF